MKIKGRLIATLAALGLLIAMLPIGPASAAVGKVSITDGFDGKFFSDQTGFNVVTLSVTDQDLSPPRIGYARFTYTNNPNVSSFNLNTLRRSWLERKARPTSWTASFSSQLTLTAIPRS